MKTMAAGARSLLFFFAKLLSTEYLHALPIHVSRDERERKP